VIRLLKSLLPVALLAGGVILILSMIGKVPNPIAAIGKAIDGTINKPQPGTSLDNITPGSWQDFFSLPYRLMNALGLMPDLPPIPEPGTKPNPAPANAPDSELYPGDPGGTYVI
jgi:hypothetical protein